MVKVNQKVEVTVLAVDADRKRISLSMKKNPGEKPPVRDKVEQTAPTAVTADARKIKPGKPQEANEKKRGKEPPKPFNNPFADALRRR